MCLSIPGKVIAIKGDEAIIDYGGEKRTASTALKKDVAVGDFVIVSAKMIMEKVPEAEALETLRMWDKTEKQEEVQR